MVLYVILVYPVGNFWFFQGEAVVILGARQGCFKGFRMLVQVETKVILGGPEGNFRWSRR